MQPLRQVIRLWDGDEIMALDDVGMLWLGKMVRLNDRGDTDIEWTPLPGPKDGHGITPAVRSRWERIEREAYENLGIDPSGEALRMAETEETESGSAGGTVRRAPDDSVEDGKGADPDSAGTAREGGAGE